MGKKKRARAIYQKRKKKVTPTIAEWEDIYEMGLQKVLHKQIEDSPAEQLKEYLNEKEQLNRIHNEAFNFLRKLQEKYPNKFPQNNIREHGMLAGIKKGKLIDVILKDLKQYAKKQYNAIYVNPYSYTKKGKTIKILGFLRMPITKNEDTQIIQLVKEGKNNKQIAQELKRSEKSIKMRKYRLKKKGDI